MGILCQKIKIYYDEWNFKAQQQVGIANVGMKAIFSNRTRSIVIMF
jgi:hypothetical protein